jgi:hypothetical protein
VHGLLFVWLAPSAQIPAAVILGQEVLLEARPRAGDKARIRNNLDVDSGCTCGPEIGATGVFISLPICSIFDRQLLATTEFSSM